MPSPETDALENLPPIEPWDVICARCGHTVSTNDATPEEGDEWECLPCNYTHDKLELLQIQRDELLEALERAAENMKRAAEFHGCSNCREGEKLARAAIRKARGEGKA